MGGLVAAAAIAAVVLPGGFAPDPAIPTEPVTLLWLEGRATQPGSESGVRLALDGAGGVLRIDSRLRVTRVPLQLGGREAASVAAARDGGLWLTDAGGDLIRTDAGGRVLAAAPSPFAYPTVAGRASAGPWLVRSAERFAYDAGAAGAPLLLRVRRTGAADPAPVGRAVLPAHFLLSDLANAGHLAVGEGAVFYAPFIRDEVVALAPSGDTLWLTRRGLPQSTTEPRFEVRGGRVVVDYHPVNLGITLGTDGRLYVLGTPGFTTAKSRLDVMDPADGRLLATTNLPTARPTLAVGRAGRIYLLDAARLLHGVPERDREPVPELDLPSMGGGRFSSAGAARARGAPQFLGELVRAVPVGAARARFPPARGDRQRVRLRGDQRGGGHRRGACCHGRARLHLPRRLRPRSAAPSVPLPRAPLHRPAGPRRPRSCVQGDMVTSPTSARPALPSRRRRGVGEDAGSQGPSSAPLSRTRASIGRA